ncbi:MAG TPA: acetyl-CoA carboxylase biotin carboxylase subunit [Deltaproteobacteria bacterium]|nr:acetyl-CoA carboxylase biotin carboxylase subunit [Deltaproteobacteria bacterium]
MFEKILIANRGEIAVRIMATCREMGIRTVAVYSEADREALHVLEADEAVLLGPAEPSQSYLNMDRIIAAAKETGAQAIHPGYGFLAENASFADRCEGEKIVFIGPPAKAIRDLGDKTVARRTMQGSGVPVIPGMLQPEEDPKKLSKEANEIGYPVLIKAAGGGGGKGMRVVRGPEDFEDACISAAREAKGAFGNGDIYLEKYIDRPRHVEFQILADAHGNAIHLLERECSIQRRHQKIIEETPSPALTPELREAMGQAAVAAARASGYVNAGTVEFLLDQDGRFYFLEVNTRLQVEHPITEMITGIDLVRQQIEIAAGNPLRLSQEDVVGRGHAIECRIYAEDPLSAFMPSPGRIQFVKEPRGPGIRNDTGVYSGFTVPMEYDPILAKLIVHGGSRKACLERMTRALHDYVILGVLTPIPFLVDVLRSEAFVRGDTYTDFIDTHFAGWQPGTGDADLVALAYVIDQAAGKKAVSGSARADAEESSPWRTLGNFRP